MSIRYTNSFQPFVHKIITKRNTYEHCHCSNPKKFSGQVFINIPSDAPNVFLIATSFSFCSIIKLDNANNPRSATANTTELRIENSNRCFKFIKSPGKILVHKISFEWISRFYFCFPVFLFIRSVFSAIFSGESFICKLFIWFFVQYL